MVLAAPAALLVAAGAYLHSVVTQRGIRPGPSPVSGPARSTPKAQAREGVAAIWQQPLLRRITVANTLNNAAVMAANTLLPVIALTQLELNPATYAAIGTLGAISGIAGAIGASAITERIGLRTTRLIAGAGLVLGTVLVMLAGIALPVLPGPAVLWLAVQSALAGFCTAVAMVAGSDLVPRLCAPEQLGTVMGAQRTLVLGIMPVSALIIGILGGSVGLTAATFLWLALNLAAVFPCFKLDNPDEPHQVPSTERHS